MQDYAKNISELFLSITIKTWRSLLQDEMKEWIWCLAVVGRKISFFIKLAEACVNENHF